MDRGETQIARDLHGEDARECCASVGMTATATPNRHDAIDTNTLYLLVDSGGSGRYFDDQLIPGLK